VWSMTSELPFRPTSPTQRLNLLILGQATAITLRSLSDIAKGASTSSVKDERIDEKWGHVYSEYKLQSSMSRTVLGHESCLWFPLVLFPPQCVSIIF
jgi:hypothetical protein